MLLDVFFFSLIVALIRKGKLGRLANIPLKRLELIILAFLIQFGLVLLGKKAFSFLLNWGAYLHILSYLLLLVAMWYNRHIREMKIIGLGILINFIVILANGGEMPVSTHALLKAHLEDFLHLLSSKTYVIYTILTDNARLKFLADVIPLPPPYPRPRVLSIGDIIMAVGLFLLIQREMVQSKAKGSSKQVLHS